MKKILLLCALYCMIHVHNTELKAQSSSELLELKNLDVPNSSAFILLDISPSIIETPTTPKEFGLSFIQNFDRSEGWPQNYAVDFTPYWWFNPKNRNAYSLFGLKKNEEGKYVENIFSSAKMVNVSVGFVNKDMTEDEVDETHKSFAIGFRTTLIKIQKKGYADELSKKMSKWHDDALGKIEDISTGHIPGTPLNPSDIDGFEENSVDISSIEESLQQRPLFSLDLGSGYSGHLSKEKSISTGRVGLWTNLAFNKPYLLNEKQNYLEFYLASRYLFDSYYIDEMGNNINDHFCDYGGKIALELGRIKLGVEALGRRSISLNSNDYRINGTATINIINNVLLVSSLGKNFNQENLSFQLGFKWGLGVEKIIFEREM